MLGDLLSMDKLKVVVKSDKGQQKYDIDINDYFWSKNASLPFPTVASHSILHTY